jgi:hypothetical protein
VTLFHRGIIHQFSTERLAHASRSSKGQRQGILIPKMEGGGHRHNDLQPPPPSTPSPSLKNVEKVV